MSKLIVKSSDEVVLITGCSTGIGTSIALYLARLKTKYVVLATMRRGASRKEGKALQDTAAKENLRLFVLDLDVNDPKSCDRCVAEARSLASRIDILVNNAGVSATVQSVEENSMSEYKRVMETNYFGSVRMIKQVLPEFRKRRSGTVINVTSLAARVWMSAQGPYNASKAAMQALSATLAIEMKRFGVHVATVLPGVIMTPILLKEQADADLDSEYVSQVRHLKKFYQGMAFGVGTPPTDVSKVVERILNERSAPDGLSALAYTVGIDAEGYITTLREKGNEWWVKEAAIERDDQGNVDFIYENSGIDISSRYRTVKKPSSKL